MQAYGKREFYTPEMAQAPGARRATTSAASRAPRRPSARFYLDLAADPNFKELYLDNEKYDGYFRDRCVFRPDINIEDTMNVIVKYKTGATLSYSLNAFNAWEGYTIAFNGTKGRLEHSHRRRRRDVGRRDQLPGRRTSDRVTTRIIPLRGKPQDIEPWTGTGGHGGGDNVMLTEVFGTARARQVQARGGRTQRPVLVPDRRIGQQELRDAAAR